MLRKILKKFIICQIINFWLFFPSKQFIFVTYNLQQKSYKFFKIKTY